MFGPFLVFSCFVIKIKVKIITIQFRQLMVQIDLIKV